MSKREKCNGNTLSASQRKNINYLLSYKIYNKGLDKIKFKKGLEANITHRLKKASGNLRLNDDFVFENDILAITDIDDDYYKCVNGRVLNLFKPKFKSINVLLNKRLQIQYERSIRRDYILNIDTNYMNEVKCYNMSASRLADQAKYFDSFILEGYEKSKFLLSQCEKFSAEVEEKIKEMQNVANQLFTVKLKLIGLDYKYGVLQKYGRFLYYLSPPSWRAKNREFAQSIEIEAKGFDVRRISEQDTFSAIFNELEAACYGRPVAPVMYFKQPSDLIAVFNAIEKQELYYFTHVNHLEPQTKLLNDNIRVLKNLISQDYSVVDEVISNFKALLEFTERSSAQLKKEFFKLLYGQFFQSTGTKEVLKLQINLEYCYEKVFLDKPGNKDIMSIAKALERYFFDYSKLLDVFQNDSVRRAMAQYSASERLKYKMGEIATKELRLFNRLKNRLHKAYGFVEHDKNVPVSQTLSNRTKKMSKNSCKIKMTDTLNAAELEHLNLFTEWCENENPEEYLKGLNLKE